jgi:hypothetical protein
MDSRFSYRNIKAGQEISECYGQMYYNKSSDVRWVGEVVLFFHTLVNGTVSPGFKVFFIIYEIKSVLSLWTLMF